MDQKEINKRIFETLAKFKERLDKLEKDLKIDISSLKSDMEYLREIIPPIRDNMKKITEMGRYKQKTCKNMIDGKCKVWVVGEDNYVPEEVWCAICIWYERG